MYRFEHSFVAASIVNPARITSPRALSRRANDRSDDPRACSTCSGLPPFLQPCAHREPTTFAFHAPPVGFTRVHQLNPCTKDSVAPTGAQELGTSPSWACHVTRGLTTTAVTPPASSLPASGPAACSSWWPPPSRGCRGRARSRSSCCPPPPTDWAAASFCSISR